MIELKNISISFGKQQVLRNINMVFQSGEVVGLVAPNGTGKSTLLNVMMNYLKPKQGEVIIEERRRYKNPKKNSKIYQVISMMPDQNDLYDHLSGYEHLKLYQSMWKTKHLKIDELIKRLEMSHYVKKKVGSYSLGMKQRLCFAMQIMSDTKIMLVDEVMNGLDPNNVELISNVILEKKEEGKTIIIASHLLENLEKYSDRIFFVSGGNLELFLDKSEGYADDSTYIKLSHVNFERIQELFSSLYQVELNHYEMIIRVQDDEHLSETLTTLISHGYNQFSVGYLSLSDAYQLKF